jgi:uncharacterized protein YdaU (DUF1376 family)
MAARWQQWMPFHIDRFRGSPDVQAMHPCARIGYLYLLSSAWQTDDCSIPADDLDLASLSGLGDDLWQLYKPRILRKFVTREDGRLFNQVLFREWLEAKRIFEARSAAARNTTATRSPNGHRTPTATPNERRPSRSADTITGTVTTTGTEEPNTLALTSVEVPAGGVFDLPLPGNQGEWQVPDSLYREMVEAYPGVNVMAEFGKMRAWLITNSSNRRTVKGIPRFMNNWLAKAQDSPRGGNNGATRANFRNHGKTAGNIPAAAGAFALLDAQEANRADVDEVQPPEGCGSDPGDPGAIRGRLIDLRVG